MVKGKSSTGSRHSFGSLAFDIINNLLMFIVIVITLYPFWEQLVISFSAGTSAFEGGFKLWPKEISFETWKLALNYDLVWTGYRNSIVRTVLGTLLGLLFTSMLAYPLSKSDMPFNKAISGFILFTMLFSGGLIPSYLLIKQLGLINSIWALVLPMLVSAFNVIILRNFFKSVPDALEESAKIDGASWLTIWWKIIMPLSKPVLATVGLWIMVLHWNSWFDAMLYAQNSNNFTLPLVLRKLIMDNDSSNIQAVVMQMQSGFKFETKTLNASVLMLSVIPMLMVYPFLQKYFTQGIMLGAVKG